MASMWIGALTWAKQGQSLKATLKVVTSGGAGVPGAVVTVKTANKDGGVFRDFTADNQGNITVSAPDTWSLTPGPYDVKVCAISKAGNTWDNKQGFTTKTVSL